MTLSGHAHLCRCSSWRIVPSLNGINQVILSPWATALSCVMPTLHNGPDLPPPKLPLPGAGGCRSGPHLTQYGIELAKANHRALQKGILIQSSCLSTAHECDRHTRRTDGHSCSSLELELAAVVLRSLSFLVPNLVEFSIRDLKVLTVSASMTSCDKWFQFCSTRWLKNFLCRLNYCVARL